MIVHWRIQCPERRGRVLFAVSLRDLIVDELCHKSCPACLVTRAQPGAIITVEVLVEQHQVSPVRITLEQLDVTRNRTSPICAAQENPA